MKDSSKGSSNKSIYKEILPVSGMAENFIGFLASMNIVTAKKDTVLGSMPLKTSSWKKQIRYECEARIRISARSAEIYTMQLLRQSFYALLLFAALTSLGFFTSMEKETSRPEAKTKQG